MAFEVKGIAIMALPKRTGISAKTGEPWESRQYIIETQEQYPRKILFDVFGADKLAQFDIHKNDFVKVQFDISCREYNGKWFNQISAFRVEKINPDQPTTNAAPTNNPSSTSNATPTSNQGTPTVSSADDLF